MAERAAIERHIIGEAWTSDLTYRNLLQLCDQIGHRFGGSALEHEAAMFLQQRMTEYGLRNVRADEFPMYGWERGTCLLVVTSPVERSFSAIAMPYTGTVEIEGELIDVGEGEEPDFARLGEAVRGKIVLTDAETNRPGENKSHRTDKYRRAVEAGATACVFVNRNPGLLHITGALYARNPGSSDVHDHEAPIAGIGISYEAGETIRRLARRDAGAIHLRIRTRNSVYRSHSSNVIGEIPGDGQSDEIVLLGGHYDGHDIAQGASDNAAGALVGLEVGRLLAPFAGQLRRTIRVICYGCEEIGLLGSWHDADRYAQGGEDLRVMINLDGAGRGEGGQEQLNATADPSLADYFAGLADEIQYELPTRSELSAHSDNFPYFLAGYPSVTLNSRDWTAGMIGRGWGHTEADTVDKVRLRGLQSAAALVARLATALADADELPFARRGPEEVRAILDDAGQLDLLTKHWGRDNRADQ